MLSQVEAQLPVHRERLLPPTETLAMFLAQSLNADRRLRGHWLRHAGFPPNGRIRVSVRDDCLVMTCEPATPPKTRRR